MAKNQYIDLDLNFILHPVRKDISRLIDDNAVKQALKNLLFTNYYERPFQPNFGCGVHALLFEPMMPSTTIAIEKAIREAIANYEPRVEIRQLTVKPNYGLNAYEITLIFTILDKQHPVQLDVIMERLR